MEILKIGAKWCGGCKVIAPYFEEFKQQGYNIQDMDAEDNQEYCVSTLKVKNLPTVIVLKNGVEVERMTGRKTKEEYLETFKKYN